jgi:hypothetical protein
VGRDRPGPEGRHQRSELGVGAWYTWAGNKEVGKGKMQKVAIEDQKKVVEKLEFIEPFESKADVVLTTDSVAAGTKITWASTRT